MHIEKEIQEKFKIASHKKTYTGFSGTNKIAVDKDGKEIGTIQAFAYAYNRKPAPLYTVGNEPEKTKAAKTKIVGQLVFIENTIPFKDFPEKFDLIQEAANEEGERAIMKVIDIEIISDKLETEEYLTYIADEVTPWTIKD